MLYLYVPGGFHEPLQSAPTPFPSQLLHLHLLQPPALQVSAVALAFPLKGLQC